MVKLARSTHGDSLANLERKSVVWNGLVREVASVIREMPLRYLQNIGRQRLDFLYDESGSRRRIELRPGVVFCFRKFHALITDLVRGAWLRYVRQRNLALIGDAADLNEFLFGSERANLAAVRGVLQEMQHRCFYCGSVLRPTTTEVDHFVSWSRYPADLGHNFVLADRSCNNRKRDRLPAYQHLCAWVERNETYHKELSTHFGQVGVLHNLSASFRVTNWAYSQTEAANGLTWLKADELVPLPWEWRQKLEGLC